MHYNIDLLIQVTSAAYECVRQTSMGVLYALGLKNEQRHWRLTGRLKLPGLVIEGTTPKCFSVNLKGHLCTDQRKNRSESPVSGHVLFYFAQAQYVAPHNTCIHCVDVTFAFAEMNPSVNIKAVSK